MASFLRSATVVVFVTAGLALALFMARDIGAADHGDAPIAAFDRAADIADLFLFLDPNDNSRVVIAGAFGSPLAPAEGQDFGIFDDSVRYRFELETTGDAQADAAITVRFSRPSPALLSPGAQAAAIRLPGGYTFTAPTTPATLDAVPSLPVITHDDATGVDFFAGLVDDAFFFDVPAELGFHTALMACVASNPSSPNPACVQAARTKLMRGRDSFAGYNTQIIALEVPVSLLRNPTMPGHGLGVNLVTERQSMKIVNKRIVQNGSFFAIDRLGVPTFTEFFVPYERREEYNFSTTEEDASGLFSRDIVAVLRSLGTDATSIQMLLNLAVTRGDYLRVDLNTPNSGPGGGNALGAGFPNGRRPSDDIIDTILTLVNNRQPLGDNVPANDVVNRDVFPFFADTHQPAPPGTIDDGTRN